MRRGHVVYLLCVGVLSLVSWGCGSKEEPGAGGSGGGAGGSAPTHSTEGGGGRSAPSTSTGPSDAGSNAADSGSNAATTTGFSVGGTVVGLEGTGLTLSEGFGYPLAIKANGAFTFLNRVAANKSVTVTVTAQPTQPSQNCTVSSGDIKAVTADVTNIVVACATVPYFVGGTVTGLSAGNTVVLANNSADPLSVTANGAFKFPGKVGSGHTYTVSVQTQPGGTTPQTCKVSGGAGTVVAADVATVTVNCSNNSFTIGGTVDGLAGTGLVLQDNNGDDLPVTANGTFAFATPVASASPFAVTVKTQPSGPTQACTVASGTGTVAASDIRAVVVNCKTSDFSVGGTVTGLAGTGLTLQDNLGDNLPVSANGSFSFPTNLASGSTYSVTVLNQPTNPSQTCAVTQGSGTVGGGKVTSVSVACTTTTFAVGGTVSGLTGTGLVLQDNGGDSLPVDANGTFAFATQVASGAGYAVTVLTQPASGQCHVAGGTGKVGGGPVTTVSVICAAGWYSVGGTITGLAGTGLSLSLNGGASLAVTASGTYSFADTVAYNSGYTVGLTGQPTNPSQSCVVANALGTSSGADVTNVDVTCTTNSYMVGGTVSGLSGNGGAGSVTLENNGGDDIVIGTNGAFQFAMPVTSGQAYFVTVKASPTSPLQTCAVANGTGTMGGGEITNVAIACATNTYPVGGKVSGLAGALVLQNQGGDNLTVTGNGTFTFPTSIQWGKPYNVTVLTPPAAPSQTCTVTAGNGTVSAAVTTVTIDCVTNSFTIGGTVTGLTSGSVTLQNNGGDNVQIAGTGTGTTTFVFPTKLLSGTTYAATIFSKPTTAGCTITGGTGTVGAANVTSVTVNCGTLRTIGGTVTGLSGKGLVLQDNGGDDLSVSGTGTFAFATTVPQGGTYSVTVLTSPNTPWQTCSVTSGSGTVGATNVSVAVDCVSNLYTVNANVTGLVGTGLVLQNNVGDNLSVGAVGTTPFATQVASGKAYSVTVLTQPTSPSQTCTVASPSGTVAGADVTVAVTCVTNTFSIGGTVIGTPGTGLILKNNGGDSLAVSAAGTFTFATKVASGGSYAVTIGTQPGAPRFCTVKSNGSGTVGSTAVTNVTVACGLTYSFDTSVQGWGTLNTPGTATALSWASTVDQGSSTTSGALLTTLAYTAAWKANAVTKVFVTPPALNATGLTLTAWVRVDAAPNSDRSGGIELYAVDSTGASTGAPYFAMSGFTLGTWRQLTWVLPSTLNWSSVKTLGIQVQPGTTSYQTAKIHIDNVTLQ